MVCLAPQHHECEPSRTGVSGQVTCDGMVVFTVFGDGETKGSLESGIAILEELIDDDTYQKRELAGMMLGMLKAIKKAKEPTK